MSHFVTNNSVIQVSGFDIHIKENELKDVFKVYGSISEIHIDETRKPRIAHIKFLDPADARAALQRDMWIGSNRLHVRPAKINLQEVQMRSEKERIQCTIYVTKICTKLQEYQILEAFQYCGKIQGYKIRNLKNGNRVAYFEYEDKSSVKCACVVLNGREIGYKKLQISKYYNIMDKKRVIIKHLPKNVTEEVLKSFFNDEIEMITFLSNENAAIIEFYEIIGTENALRKDGKVLLNSTVDVIRFPRHLRL